MKKWILSFLLLLALGVNAQFKPFRFAFVTDTHIGSPSGLAEEDLIRTVRDINSRQDIDFVVITGDVTELGTTAELKEAKRLLDSLHIPYFIIPGNHDTGWSESGGDMFTTVFGNDKFSFEHNGIRFMGCASGPYVRMSDGHVPRHAVNWMDEQLRQLKPGQPLIFFNHYPLDNSLDNWYEITDRLRKHNTLVAICGHGHANKAMNFEDIPGVMGRSNLRAQAAVGGYNIVDVQTDSIFFSEKKPGNATLRRWHAVSAAVRSYNINKAFPRPDYSMNTHTSLVKARWTYASEANIISTPAVAGKLAVVGNQNGTVTAHDLRTGKKRWTYKAGGAIFSSPAVSNGNIIFGAADGNIYCLNSKNGRLVWKTATGAAVLGSPLVNGDTVFIGGSGNAFYALDAGTGKMIWTFNGVKGAIVSKPLWYEGKIIFGAWDRHLYALSSHTGALQWQWNNGTLVINFSPAACIPVAANGVVYVVAPDRYISAIDAVSGQMLWRNNDATVRESIGISANGERIYAKTMQDTIAVYQAGREKQNAVAKIHCGFGYEHVPSMLLEQDGKVYFGTRNGVVYCIDPTSQQVIWRYKIDNSMVNTLRMKDAHSLLASTMDGKMVLLEF